MNYGLLNESPGLIIELITNRDNRLNNRLEYDPSCFSNKSKQMKTES